LDAIVSAGSPQLLTVAAWPLRVVQIDDKTAVLLTKIENARHIIHLYDIESRRQFFPGAHWKALAGVARDVAKAYAQVHAAGFVAADISDTNVLVLPNLVPKLIDCDSYIPCNGGSATARGIETTFWLAPELHGVTQTSRRTPDHDNFSLARLIFCLLFLGSDPLAPPPGSDPDTTERAFAFSRRHPIRAPSANELTLDDLSPEVAEMFEEAFLPRQRAFGPRPTAAAWEAALDRLCANLEPCPKVATHWKLKKRDCPWCDIVARGCSDPFKVQDVPSPKPKSWIERNWLKAAVIAFLYFLAKPLFHTTPPPPDATPSITKANDFKTSSGGRAQTSPSAPPPDAIPSTTKADDFKISSVGRAETVPSAPPPDSRAAPSAPVWDAAAKTALEQRAGDFVTRYIASHNDSDDTANAFVEQAYADQVMYEGRQRDKAFVVRQKEALIAKWRFRSYAARSGTLRVECASSSTCEASVVADYTVSRPTEIKPPRSWLYAFTIDASSSNLVFTQENGRDVTTPAPSVPVEQHEEKVSTPPPAPFKENVATNKTAGDSIGGGRGWLGVEIQSVDAKIAAKLGMSSVQGVLVTWVPEDSPARAAGVKEGDVIVQLDNKSINDASKLVERVRAHAPTSDAPLRLLRNGEEITTNATVGERPAMLDSGATIETQELKLRSCPEFAKRCTEVARMPQGLHVEILGKAGNGWMKLKVPLEGGKSAIGYANATYLRY
jgi:serine/threonine protein kinase